MAIMGAAGQIKWHYYVAAEVNGYTVTRKDSQWSLRGTVALSDAYKMAQTPLMFVATHVKGEWRWPIQTLQLVDGALSATLGAPLP